MKNEPLFTGTELPLGGRKSTFSTPNRDRRLQYGFIYITIFLFSAI